jgi:hypothetical protein
MGNLGAGVDLITMTDAQVLILDRMSDDLSYPFADIAADTGQTVAETRRIIRHFHSIGLTGYGTIFDQDGEGVRGRGYWLLKAGWDLRGAARKMVGWRWICDRQAQAFGWKPL